MPPPPAFDEITETDFGGLFDEPEDTPSTPTPRNEPDIEAIALDPLEFTPLPAEPPSSRSGSPAAVGIDRDTPLNVRIPGARISQTFRIPAAAFEIPIDEIPIDESAMVPPPPEPRPLPEIPLFSGLDETRLHHLIQSARVVRCQPGDVVVRQGERGESLFVVVHGTMAVRVDGAPEPMAHLGEGEFFGELALLSSEPRTATVEAEGEAEVIEIRRDAVWALIEEAPDVLPVLLRFFRDRLTERLIATSPLFSPFTGAESRQLAARFQFLELTTGSELVREGERAEGLYVLLLGRGDVRMARMGTVAFVGPGDLVGEISLLTRGPATATVVAATPVWALAMPRAVFQEVILTHPQVLIYVNEVAEQRRNADNSRIDMI